MRKPKIFIVFMTVSLLLGLWVASVQAQVVGGGWSEPYLLSSDAGKSSEGFSVADQYGNLHLFWVETLFKDNEKVIRYARFGGETWSSPNDIYSTGLGIKNVSPVVDQQGTLHIAWAEGLYGPAYYTHAPANNAFSVQSWAKPIQIDISARIVILRIDPKGVFHIVYIDETVNPGVYYIRSEDQGETWSKPVWLDPDILPNHVPDSLSFELDENSGLHAVWFYGALDQTSTADLVRYTHSFDGGDTWSKPFTIDQHFEENDHNLSFASPKMIIAGTTVHVIWAAGELPHRYHRFSTDAGQTWSEPRQVFGDLHGQAFDGLAVDGAGRVHYFGQIRYPQGIYTAYWDQTQWSPISLVYLIVPENSDEGMGNRVHAHYTLPVVRAGNQLVLTFTDGPSDPNRRLFAMYRSLDDVPPIEPLPAPPALIPTPTPMQPTSAPTVTATASIAETSIAQPLEQNPRQDTSIWMALVPALLLFGGILVFQVRDKRKH